MSPADGAGDTGTLVVHAPASGERVGEVSITTPDEVRAAIARARSAFEMWRSVPLEERCDRLLRFRDALVDRADELIELLVKETGKPRQEALLHEVMPIVDTFTYLSRRAPVILQPKELPLHLFKHKKSVVHHLPRGVIGVISPWNFPFTIPMGDVAAALVNRQRGHREAERGDAPHHEAHQADLGRHRAAGRSVPGRVRTRRRGQRAHRGGRAEDRLHRRRRHRSQGRRRLRSRARPLRDGARRQGAAHRLRRLRPRADRAGHRLGRLRQQRPGVRLGGARVRSPRDLRRARRAG